MSCRGACLTVRKFSRFEHGPVPDVARGRRLAFVPSMHVVGAVVRSHRSVMTSERRGEYSIREDFLKIGERRGEDSPLEALTPSVPADTRS